MGRGVSAGGGQSSLEYLFALAPPPQATAPKTVDSTKQVPTGHNSNSANNYIRADGQNTSNFITDWPSTKVHSAPGGGSSLDYLFGGGSN